MTTRPTLRPALTSLLICTLLSIATAAFAQNGTITGTVTNAATSANLANVTVEAYTLGGILAGSGFSNGSGQYSISVPAGSYKLRVARIGLLTRCSR